MDTHCQHQQQRTLSEISDLCVGSHTRLKSMFRLIEKGTNKERRANEIANFQKYLRRQGTYAKQLLLNDACVNLQLNFGEKQALEAHLIRINEYKLRSKRLLNATKADSNNAFAIEGGRIDASANVVRNIRSSRVSWVEHNSAFKSRLKTAAIYNLTHRHIEGFLEDCFALIRVRLRNLQKKFNNVTIKLNTILYCDFIKPAATMPDVDCEEDDTSFSFCTKNFIILPADLVDNDENRRRRRCHCPNHQSVACCSEGGERFKDLFKIHVVENLTAQLSSFAKKESGWSLRRISSLAVHTNICDNLFHWQSNTRSGSVAGYNAGGSFIDLPPQIKAKKACINIQNKNDDGCFFWSIVAQLYPAHSNPCNISSYPHFTQILNLANIADPSRIPMKLNSREYKLFFKQNPSISANIYGLKLTNKNFRVVPLVLADDIKINHVNMLMIKEYYDDDADDRFHHRRRRRRQSHAVADTDYDIQSSSSSSSSGSSDSEGESEMLVHDNRPPQRYHFVLIKNLSRLVSAQISAHDGKVYVCARCLCYFREEAKLMTHTIECKQRNQCKTILPEPGTDGAVLKFKQFHAQLKVPFVVYADIETMLCKVDDNNPALTTKKYQKHVAHSIAFHLQCNFNSSLSRFNSYRGKSCMKWFAKELLKLATELEHYFTETIPMDPCVLNEIKEREFYLMTHCTICGDRFLPDQVRVRDHDHLTGSYRGPAHQACNLQLKIKKFIPIVFHNFSAYDCHLLIKSVAKHIPGRIKLLPRTKENYISFTKWVNGTQLSLKFIDSYRFMASSLEKLVSYMPFDDFKILRSQFSHWLVNDVDGDTKLRLLTRKGVYPYDYTCDWSRFLETKLPSKSDFYNLLTDSNISDVDYAHACNVWREFKIKNLGEYSDLYLKVDVLLLADVFEQFRENAFSTYGLDPLHFCTLPSYSFQCALKYTRVKIDLLTDIDMVMFFEKAIRGGTVHCAVRYSKCNNEYHPSSYDPNQPKKYLTYLDVNNLYGNAMTSPLPTGGFQWLSREEISELKILDLDDVSDTGYMFEVDLNYPAHLHDHHADLPFCPEKRTPPNSKQMKLLTTLHHKERYVLHFVNLKQCLRAGLKLTKIHRVIKFKQSAWLRDYIELNTKLRAASTNEFQRNLYKLKNNAIYGKTLENVRGYRDVKLISRWDGKYGASHYISLPEFHSSAIFDKNLVAIELNKTEITFDKPIFIGACILDLSKTYMYDFHYNVMVDKVGRENVRLLYTDTDSFTYELLHTDIYHFIKQNPSFFDTSGYAEDNPYGIVRANNKVLGKLKDELEGRVFLEFAGLRAKMYALRAEGLPEVKKSKGVSIRTVKNTITFDDYIDCLRNNILVSREQRTIRSFNHELYSMRHKKIALSSNDDKRFVCPNGIDTLPWGHYSLSSFEELD